MRGVGSAVEQFLDPRTSERFSIALPAFVRVGAQDYTAKLLNLDRSGAMLETTAPLAVNSRLVVTCGTVAADAIVVWTTGDRAGVSFERHLSGAQIAEHRLRSTALASRRSKAENSESLMQRTSLRVSIEATVKLRRRGSHNFMVQVFDLSPTGCKLEFIEAPQLDETVWLKFEGLEPLEANVRWLERNITGVEFVRPIHPAVFELLVDRLR